MTSVVLFGAGEEYHASDPSLMIDLLSCMYTQSRIMLTS